MKFTNTQQQAINTTNGNVLVIASAGSGKTSVFTNRIAKLILEEGIQPNRILAVTFTKKASGEMRERLANLVGESVANRVVMGTFHSFANKILRFYYPSYREKEFVKDWWILKTVGDICRPTTQKNPYGLNIGIDKVKDVISYIEYMKNQGFYPNDENAPNFDVTMNEAYNSFEYLKNNANYITMSDLIIDLYGSLKRDEHIRRTVASLFDKVQIDEFQDTSDLVLNCIKLINKENVFVVGDFRQSIFSFIGAEVNNILSFGEHFDNVQLIELQDNFRSSENIVNFSNEIIENAPVESYKRFKPSKAFKGLGEDVKFRTYQTEEEEAEDILNQIEEAIQKGTKPNEIAVILRTNAQIGFYEEVFNQRGIKCDVSRDGSFFNYGEVIDILSYLRLAVNQGDNTSVRRVINRPSRFLSNKLISDMDIHAKANDLTLIEALNEHPSATMGYQAKNIQDFLYVIQELARNVHSEPHKLIQMVLKLTDYRRYVKDISLTKEKQDTKNENINKLIKIAKKYKDVRSMLRSIDDMEKNRRETNRDGVQVMTIHKSKGLEYDVVFVPALVEGVLPHKMSFETNNIEEERRLFYVASSRAREQLQVSNYHQEVKLNEDGEIIDYAPVEPSQFVQGLVG